MYVKLHVRANFCLLMLGNENLLQTHGLHQELIEPAKQARKQLISCLSKMAKLMIIKSQYFLLRHNTTIYGVYFFSIRQPCLNFNVSALYMWSCMLPCSLRGLDELLLIQVVPCVLRALYMYSSMIHGKFITIAMMPLVAWLNSFTYKYMYVKLFNTRFLV